MKNRKLSMAENNNTQSNKSINEDESEQDLEKWLLRPEYRPILEMRAKVEGKEPHLQIWILEIERENLLERIDPKNTKLINNYNFAIDKTISRIKKEYGVKDTIESISEHFAGLKATPQLMNELIWGGYKYSKKQVEENPLKITSNYGLIWNGAEKAKQTWFLELIYLLINNNLILQHEKTLFNKNVMDAFEYLFNFKVNNRAQTINALKKRKSGGLTPLSDKLIEFITQNKQHSVLKYIKNYKIENSINLIGEKSVGLLTAKDFNIKFDQATFSFTDFITFIIALLETNLITAGSKLSAITAFIAFFNFNLSDIDLIKKNVSLANFLPKLTGFRNKLTRILDKPIKK